jgi:hypothetical protein
LSQTASANKAQQQSRETRRLQAAGTGRDRASIVERGEFSPLWRRRLVAVRVLPRAIFPTRLTAGASRKCAIPKSAHSNFDGDKSPAQKR